MKLPIVIEGGTPVWMATFAPVNMHNDRVRLFGKDLRYNEDFTPVLPDHPVIREYSEMSLGFLFYKHEGRLYSIISGSEVTGDIDVYGQRFNVTEIEKSMTREESKLEAAARLERMIPLIAGVGVLSLITNWFLLLPIIVLVLVTTQRAVERGLSGMKHSLQFIARRLKP